MKPIAQYLLLATVLSSSTGYVILAQSAIADSRHKLQIDSVSNMSFSKPYGYHDEHFWDIVRLGRAAIPDLLILVEDDSSTGLEVDLFGGEYSVGDIAVLALWKIYPDLPLVQFVDDPQQSGFETMGFGVYWACVRESSDNRRRLQARVREWINKNESKHQWAARADHPAGGWYALEPEQDE